MGKYEKKQKGQLMTLQKAVVSSSGRVRSDSNI